LEETYIEVSKKPETIQLFKFFK